MVSQLCEYTKTHWAVHFSEFNGMWATLGCFFKDKNANVDFTGEKWELQWNSTTSGFQRTKWHKIYGHVPLRLTNVCVNDGKGHSNKDGETITKHLTFPWIEKTPDDHEAQLLLAPQPPVGTQISLGLHRLLRPESVSLQRTWSLDFTPGVLTQNFLKRKKKRGGGVKIQTCSPTRREKQEDTVLAQSTITTTLSKWRATSRALVYPAEKVKWWQRLHPSGWCRGNSWL